MANARLRDAGYYLIDDGRADFEREIGYRVPIARQLSVPRSQLRCRYTSGDLVVTFGLLAIVLTASTNAGGESSFVALLAALAILPASDIAVTVVNRLVGMAVAPRHLPRLDLSEGIAASMRTFVVVPTLLGSDESIDEQVHQLEIRYLSSRPGELYFALLTDWADAVSEHLPNDRAQYDYAVAAIEKLNSRYRSRVDQTSAGHPRFYLFHRRRLWNPAQSRWMGWERKRGKLHEFNRLLRGREPRHSSPMYILSSRLPGCASS